MDKELLLKTFKTEILKSNKSYCYSLITDAYNNGMPIKEIYTEVFYPTMVHLGKLWEEGAISVGQQHLSTAIVQGIINSLYKKILDSKTNGQKSKVIITCASGELHEIGPRMLADLLEKDGFDVSFLGAHVPSQVVLEFIEKEDPLILAISCTMLSHIENVKKLIDKVKSSTFSKTPIIVGGGVFDRDGTLVKYVGADYYTKEFEHTIGLFNEIYYNCVGENYE